jgi:hypothetical protein
MIQAIPSDLQSLYYALAQNPSTQNATYQYLPIPTTISNEAQEELRNTIFDPSMLKAPDPDDLNGWKRQYHDFESRDFCSTENRSRLWLIMFSTP